MASEDRLIPAAKWVRFSTDEGRIKVQTRAYRLWYRDNRELRSSWPGVEILDAPDEITGRKWAESLEVGIENGGADRYRNRDGTVSATATDRYRNRYPGSLYTCYPSLVLNKYNKGKVLPTFAILPFEDQLLMVCRDPAFRLLTVLLAYARTYQKSSWKITKEMRELAGIRNKCSLSRAVAYLESLKVIRVHRTSGASSTVEIKLNSKGSPVLFK